MNKNIFLVALMLATLSAYGQSKELSLDEAIQNASVQIQNGLSKGSTVIVYQFQSHNPRLSDYVLKELFDKLVNSRKFIVLDRSAQEVVNVELDFQLNVSEGMISDDSLASLTKRLGAQAIITGSLDDAASEYRFRVKAIGTETTAAIVSYAVSVNKNDRRTTAFLNKPPGAGQKIGTGTLNILLGLGSYLQRDISGGVTITAGYAVAAGLFAVEAAALDWDSPAVGVPATIGFAVAGATFVYGFVRPFIYNRSGQLAAIMDNARLGVVMVSDGHAADRAAAFQLSYSIKF